MTLKLERFGSMCLCLPESQECEALAVRMEAAPAVFVPREERCHWDFTKMWKRVGDETILNTFAQWTRRVRFLVMTNPYFISRFPLK